MKFFPKTKYLSKIVLPVLATGYMTQKISYINYPFEKHLSWMAFNVGWGAMIGQMLRVNNTLFCRKYMDLFAVSGYAMIYVAAYLFKTE